MTCKVYSQKSNIEDIGNGLFAGEDIKCGTYIVQFFGKLHKPNEKEKVKDNRSNIYFNDGCILSCGRDDVASFANDCIMLPKQQRKFMEAMKANTQFYSKHKCSVLNATIKLKEKDGKHDAYLQATQDIKEGDEIFLHYGFSYWFYQEVMNGFLYEEEIVKNGIPKNIYGYPGFALYLKEFYSDAIGYIIERYNDEIFCVIKLKSGEIFNLLMPDCEKIFLKYKLEKLEKFLRNNLEQNETTKIQ